MTENNIRVLTLNWISQDWKSDKSGYPGWIVSMDNKIKLHVCDKYTEWTCLKVTSAVLLNIPVCPLNNNNSRNIFLLNSKV